MPHGIYGLAAAGEKRKECERKSVEVFVTGIDSAKGEVEAIVSVMGIIDLGDDVIEAGAYVKTITERARKIQVLDNHQTHSMLNIIGKCLEAREVSRDELPAEILLKHPDATGGLYTKTQFFMDTPEGEGVFKRINYGVAEYSIGFDALIVERQKRKMPDGTTKVIRVIKEIRLWEYSPVIWGMNQATVTVDAKGKQTMPTKMTAPNYGGAAAEAHDRCSTCLFYQAKDSASGYCSKFTFNAAANNVCSDYEVSNQKENLPTGESKPSPAKPAQVSDYDPMENENNRFLGDMIRAGTYDAYSYRVNMFYMDGRLSLEEHMALLTTGIDMLNVLQAGIPADVAMRPYDCDEYPYMYLWAKQGQSQIKGWIAQQAKAGRVLSAANARKIMDAVDTLVNVLDSAGVLQQAEETDAETSDNESEKGTQPQEVEKVGSQVAPTFDLKALKALREELNTIA